MSFCISSTKNLSEEEVYLLIVSMRWYLKYSNGFSTEPKYQIKLKASVLITNLPGKTSLITTEHSKLQKPTQSLTRTAKKKSMVQVRQTNIENR